MRPLRASICLLIATLSSCAAPGNAPDDAVTSDRKAIASDPRYKSFASEDEAFAWAADFEQNVYAPRQSVSPRAIVPRNDPRYATAKQMVEAVWQANNALHPYIVDGLHAPYTILIEDPAVDAYAPYDDRIKQMPLAFFIQTGLLNAPTGVTASADSELISLIAHEIAHLVLAHVYPDGDKARAIHYRVLPGREELGYLQPDDPQLKASMNEYLDAAGKAGHLPYPELSGIPFPTSDDQGNLLVVAELKRKQATEPLTPECSSAIDSQKRFIDFVRANPFTYDAFSQTYAWTLNEQQRTVLSQLTASFVADGSACFATGPSLYRSIQDFTGFSNEQMEEMIAKDSDFAHRRDESFFTAAVSITKAAREKARTLQTQIDLSTIRVRTFEEEADDNAILVNHLLGKDPKGPAGLFFDMLMGAEEREKCMRVLEAGEVPPYGVLTDPHHATCYRVYHVHQFNRLIFNIETSPRQ